MQNLANFLKPEILAEVQSLFDFDISNIPCERGPLPVNVVARTHSNIFSSDCQITFNSWRMGIDADGTLSLNSVVELSTVIHELVHCKQSRRGFFYRAYRALGNFFLPWEKQADEKEATKFAEAHVSRIFNSHRS